jgi:hypothetical protein
VFWPILEAGSFRTFVDIYTRNPELVGNLKAINVRDSQALARDFIYRADVVNNRLNIANNKPFILKGLESIPLRWQQYTGSGRNT